MEAERESGDHPPPHTTKGRIRPSKEACPGEMLMVGVKQNTLYYTANGACNGIVYKCWMPGTVP